MKRILFIIITAALALVSRAEVGDTFEYGELIYKVTSETEQTVEVKETCLGIIGDLTIPMFVTNNGRRYIVTALGMHAFSRTPLKSVIIPNSVKTIGYYAFQECSELEEVVIPDSVISIGYDAFGSCSNLSSVTLPNSVITIDGSVFQNCTNLTAITIPNSVTSLGSGVFSGCTKLKEIKVESGNKDYCSIDGVLYTADKTTLYAFPGAKTEAIIPNHVVTIQSSAFSGCSNLTSVSVPNSVTSIESHAFRDCSSLKSINLPASIINMGNCAFMNCSSLLSINIPDKVTTLNSSLFRECSNLTSVSIPNSVTTIEPEVFFMCSNLAFVTIPASVMSMGSSAFGKCSKLKTIFSYNPTPQDMNKYIFQYDPEDAVIYIPKGSYMKYMLADGWSYFSDFREMDGFSVLLSKESLSLEEGESVTLEALAWNPDYITYTSKGWTSSDPGIATVSDGVVTAKSTGSAVITYKAVAANGKEYTATCKVVSTAAGVEVIADNEAIGVATVYTVNGLTVGRNLSNEDINALAPGIYIVCRGKSVQKIAVH